MNGTFFGSSGTSGTSGSSGSSGISGTSGTSGSSGTSGLDGTYFGSSGTSGLSGTSGTSGLGSNGTSGISGTSGSSGVSGTFFGSSGSSGSSGTSGAGTSGSSGTSGGGTSGTSGSSGFLVLSGTTDNGVLTYINSSGQGQVESNLTFDGSVLSVLSAGGAISSTTFRETHSSLGSGGTFTIDLASANNFSRTVSGGGTVVVSFTNAPAGRAFGFTLALTNGGSATIQWPASVRYSDNIAPILTSSGIDVLSFYTFDGGSTYYGFLVGRNLS